MKKLQITKYRFLNWLISDKDDVEYWGNRFIHELKSNGEIAITVEELFEARDELPSHLFEDQLDDKEIFEGKDIPIERIELTTIDWTEELKRCKEDPLYFFSNYFTINGRQPTDIEKERAKRTLKMIGNGE